MSSSLRIALERIREERGTLDRQTVVDAARAEDHPLHNRFEWDDSIAGEQWRLEQAGQLLRVHFRPDPSKARDLRAFVAVPRPDRGHAEYVPTVEAMSDPFTRKLVLSRMQREWRTFKRRYGDMAEFAALLDREARDVG